ncbi:MAG: phage major tail tube protein [Mesorhizobium sp.]|uniref:phage major tail tube protein n=1 Tax=Mesorhizobium sp. TaxID=1871066 RepID=UPI000FE7942D|nr:phage major tail tube protein [Mesorhizobium sp.]RWC28170.1 MAG: phage major tail tube protein [Mesorhizobium sp.]RWE59833.1 MAG: phage major tail tube protein [Mesorhizobium sp.]TIY03978.1 MAG: phage major tail tube protein [Mesorhizobium sp.]
MTAALPRQLKAFNLYFDGDSYAGRCDSITLPAITLLMEEHRAGGMDAPKKLELGMEAMTASIILSDYDPRIISLIGVDNVPLTARGALQAQGKNAEAVVVNMRGMLAVTEFSEWKPGTKSTKTLTYELDYFRYRQADVEYMEIDIINMVRRIGGVDQLATQRNAIGL